jgi:hypothetical protein
VTEEELKGIWAVDPVKGSCLAAFTYHYRKHRSEVGAENEQQYLRKAIEFKRTKRGRGEPIQGLTTGVRRWIKSRKYIDMNASSEIVSFGAADE